MTAQKHINTPSAAAQDDQQKPDRALFWVLIAVLLTLYQIIYALRVLQLQDTLEIRTSIPSLLHIGMSTAWAIAWAGVAVGLMRPTSRARQYAKWLLIGFIIYSLLRVALFAQADYDRGRLPFLLLVAAICLVGPLLSSLRGIWRTIHTGRGF